jgi:hypothetical protein
MTVAVRARRETEQHEQPDRTGGRDRRACRASELPDDLAKDIENARMDPEFDYLNALLAK